MSFRSGTALRTLRTLRLFSQVSQKTRNPSFAQVLGLSVGTGAGLIFLYVEWKKSQSPFPEAVHRPLRNALYWSEKNAPVDQILPWYQKAWEEARMLKDQNLLDPQALIGLQVEYANYLMRIGKRNEAQNIYREALNDHVKNFQTTKLTEAPWDQVKQASTLGILLADTLHPDSEEAESLYRWSFRIIGDWLKTSSMDLKQLEKQYVDAFAVAMERLASYYDAQDRLKESFAIYYSLYDLLKQSNESKLSVDHQCKIAEVCSHLADNSFNLQQPDTSMKWYALNRHL